MADLTAGARVALSVAYLAATMADKKVAYLAVKMADTKVAYLAASKAASMAVQ